ncbi:MAG: hypothetical protein RLZZ563_174 [Pseudomonadota bacterium]|jgi:hypothetical protein
MPPAKPPPSRLGGAETRRAGATARQFRFNASRKRGKTLVDSLKTATFCIPGWGKSKGWVS